MEDIKSFLHSRLRNIKGTDMSSLINICDISRAKFYKCLKEPWCFSDSDLARIADKMDLSDEDRQQLFAFKSNSDQRISQEESIITPEDEELYELAHKIIFRKKTTPTDGSNRIFTYFGDDVNEKWNITYCADDFAEDLWAKIDTEKYKDSPMSPQTPPIDILVFNSIDERHRSHIFTLIRSLYEKCPVNTIELNDLISITHYIDRSEENNGKYLHFFSDWCALMRYGYYTMDFTDKLDNTFLKFWSGCLIFYTTRQGTPKYLLVSINGQNNVSIYSFADQNLYRFLKHNTPDLQREIEVQQLLSNNFIDINPLLIEMVENHPKVTIDVDPCLTTIKENLLTEIEKTIIADSNWKGLEALKSAMGATELSKKFDNAQLINILFNGLRQRFNAEEENNVINLISSAGLKKFAHTGQLPDMKLVSIQLTTEQTIEQLQYYRDNLGRPNGANHQQYYVITNPTLDMAMHIYKEHCSLMATYKDSAPVLYFKSVSNSESSTILHNYVMNKLLSDKYRNKHTSPVMSDEMARNFIDGLILELQNQPR